MHMHIDIGGEGRWPGAINVNPHRLTSTTGEPGRPIPNLVIGRGETLPIASGVADLVTVENAPLRPGAIDEIRRVLKPGGQLRLLHPTDYALGAGIHDAIAAATDLQLISRSSTLDGIATLSTLRRAAALVR